MSDEFDKAGKGLLSTMGVVHYYTFFYAAGLNLLLGGLQSRRMEHVPDLWSMPRSMEQGPGLVPGGGE